MIIYKMNIKNKKSSSIKKLIIPAIILLVIGGSAYAYALSSNYFSANNSTNESQDLPESPNDPVPETPVNPTDNTDKENLGEEPSGSSNELPAIILTAAALNGDTLQARALIQGVIGSGICTLTIKKGSQSIVSETAAIQPGPSTSTCRGFDTPVSSIGSGAVSVSISYTVNGETRSSETTEVTINE